MRIMFFGKENQRIENSLPLSVSLLTCVFLVSSLLYNFIVGLNFSLFALSFAGIFIFLGFYLWGRFKEHDAGFRLLFGIVSLLYVDVALVMKFLSNGPLFPLLIMLYATYIMLYDAKYHKLVSLVFFTNLLALFLFESAHETSKVSNVETCINERYIVLAFVLIVVYVIVSSVKRNYLNEQERAKMSDMLKTAFVSNMSHEIRTPLNAIIGFTSLMSDTEVTENDKKIFEDKILNNSEYLLNLIEDIIDVSRIESNQLVLMPQDFDVIPVINQLVKSFGLSLQGKNVELINAIKIQKLVLHVDKTRFEQIVGNLLSNAVKFTEEGSIIIDCVEDKKAYIFSVTDTGVGIPEHQQKAIFDSYVKINNNDMEYFHRGTGIGLFLAKGLVELFGGTIWVESKVGEGSVFYFTIPF